MQYSIFAILIKINITCTLVCYVVCIYPEIIRRKVVILSTYFQTYYLLIYFLLLFILIGVYIYISFGLYQEDYLKLVYIYFFNWTIFVTLHHLLVIQYCGKFSRSELLIILHLTTWLWLSDILLVDQTWYLPTGKNHYCFFISLGFSIILTLCSGLRRPFWITSYSS